MFNSTREFEACVRVRGKPVTEVVHNGKTFVEGRKKSPYELYFHNNTLQQVLVVPSVDGISAIDGEAAGKASPGYVVNPYQDIVIPGWTVNGEEAAEFTFHAQGAKRQRNKTYVEAMGEDPRNQGAIGFMVFRPMPHSLWSGTPRHFVPPGTMWGSAGGGSPQGSGGGGVNYNADINSTVIGSVTNCAPDMNANTGETFGASASVQSSADSFGNETSIKKRMVDSEASLGTGFGEAVEFETQKVEFRREANPCAVFAFFYDTKRNLRKAGVPVELFDRHYSTSSYDTGPDPFPNSPEVAGYANAPKGWSGRKYRK